MKEITKTSANRNRHRKQTALPPRRSAIHRILVPIDFSPASLCALDYGADRARELGATIILVHVLDPILVERRFVAPRLRAMKAETRLIKKKLLFLAKRRVATGTPVRPWLLNGEPSSAIIQAAAKTESDLIIMGSAGTKGFRRMLLGSVAHRVVRDAGCPVTIVPVPRSKNHKPPRLRLGAEGGERAAIVLMGS
ncbi:MAG TPA: universal stress protein, partial [Clostridia bacterium]|nr:universal stress protein [Clostridia bacterium]